MLIRILVFSILLVLSGTAAFAAAPLITFQAALSQIISRSTGISIQEASLETTRKKNLPTRLAFLPSLSFDAKQPLGTANFLTVPQQVELTSELNLFRFGANLQGLYAANADEETQKSLVDATTLTVEEDGVTALLNEIQRAKEVEIYTRMVKTRTDSLQASEQRYKRGYLALQEYQKLVVDLENAKARMINAEIQESLARASLERLLGHSDVELVWPWKQQLVGRKALEVTQQPFELAARPDFIAAKQKVEGDTYRLNQSRRLLLPSIDSEFSYGNYNSGYFGSVIAWTGAITITLPLFDRLSSYSNSAVQASTLIASESTLEQVKRDAKAGWESSKQSFEKSVSSALSREKVLTLSRSLYEDNFRRFQAGRISVNDLEIDQTRVFDSELLAIEGWSTAHLTYTKLCHALGRRLKDCLESNAAMAR